MGTAGLCRWLVVAATSAGVPVVVVVVVVVVVAGGVGCEEREKNAAMFNEEETALELTGAVLGVDEAVVVEGELATETAAVVVEALMFALFTICMGKFCSWANTEAMRFTRTLVSVAGATAAGAGAPVVVFNWMGDLAEAVVSREDPLLAPLRLSEDPEEVEEELEVVLVITVGVPRCTMVCRLTMEETSFTPLRTPSGEGREEVKEE